MLFDQFVIVKVTGLIFPLLSDELWIFLIAQIPIIARLPPKVMKEHHNNDNNNCEQSDNERSHKQSVFVP